MTEIENKILGITNLATKAALNTEATGIENRMADAISLITTPEFNRLTKIRFDARKVAAKLFASRSHLIVQLIWNTFTNPGGDKLTKNVHPDKYGYSG